MTETYPAFILSEGKVNHNFIGKSCSKFDITLDTINNYQSNVFFSLTNGCISDKMSIAKKAHLSNTHFKDAVNHLSLGKSKFD